MTNSANPPPCHEKHRLVDDYERLTIAYSSKVSELRERIGKSTKQEYEALYRMTEALRHDVRNAQMELENHIAAHGC